MHRQALPGGGGGGGAPARGGRARAGPHTLLTSGLAGATGALAGAPSPPPPPPEPLGTSALLNLSLPQRG